MNPPAAALRSIRTLLGVACILPMIWLGAVVGAQEGGPGSIGATDGDRVMDARDRRMLSRICWQRSEPLGAEWMAEQNAAYRAEVFARYLLERTESGWRWLPSRSVGSNDLRATPEGYTDRLLEVFAGDGDRGRAELAVAGPLHTGTARFEWTTPPDRICMLEELDLRMWASVADGDPGTYGAAFLMPMSEEMLAVEGPEVTACSPRVKLELDGEAGLTEVEGACRRTLLHLQEGAGWALWVSLPESFYVVYPYAPAR